MARKSFADRIQESGKDSRDRLAKSASLIDMINSAPAAPSPTPSPPKPKNGDLVPLKDTLETLPPDGHSDGQMNGRTNGRTGEAADTPAGSRADGRTGTRADGQSGGQPDGRTGSRADTRTDGQSGGLTGGQFSGQSGSRAGSPLDWMTANQAAVLAYLNQVPEGITRLMDIVNNTGVPYGTVRKVIDKLVSIECITPIKRYQQGGRQGFMFRILPAGSLTGGLSGSRAGSRFSTQLDSRADGQSGGHSGGQFSGRTGSRFSGRTDGQSPILSSSRKEFTTTDLENRYQSDPELAIWRSDAIKLHPKQIMGWMEEFCMSLDDMIESLRHCAWDLRQRDDIDKPLDWFYRRIERYGHYAPPEGYKSFEQQRLERAQERVKKLEEMATKAAEAKARARVLEVMADPESELYKKCFAKLKPSVRKRRTGTMFEKAMECALEEIESGAEDSTDQ